MAKFHNPTKVITGVKTRWSYANVWEPKSINGGAPKYSVSLIIPKSDTATVGKIKDAIKAHMVALEDDELDAVSGGVLWFDDDAKDGHEKSCIWQWHWKNECDNSHEKGGYHYTRIGVETVNGYRHQYYYCDYCSKRLPGLS